METKKNRTIDAYKKAGSEMRLFKTLGAKLFVDISKVLSAQDLNKLDRALDTMEIISSRAEDNMFHDFPGLSNEYIDVFYGSTKCETRNKVDAEIVRMARDAADALFREDC